MRLGGPYLALSRIQTQVGVLDRLVLNRLGGSTRDSGAIVSKTPLKQARNKNAIGAAILNRVLDRDWTLNRRGPLSRGKEGGPKEACNDRLERARQAAQVPKRQGPVL